MAYLSIPAELTASLVANWGLAAPVAAANIHFDSGWFDRKWLRATNTNAQVTVSGPVASPMRYFGVHWIGGVGVGALSPGMRLISYHLYAINVWVWIPAGDERYLYDGYAEQIRLEVIRIINEQRMSYTCTKIHFAIPRDAGVARHEFDVTPQLLRYEITIQVNHMS